jgi:hypothetical protein
VSTNVVLGITVLFVLFVAGCGLWMNAASNTVDKAIDHSVQIMCYDYGYADGANGNAGTPPFSGEACAQVYANAYDDGAADNYNPPVAE